ncbi:Transposase DDE domain protein [Xylophilus ampelinus]|uniref:IS5 family transposase n=1 Tax=Variovorax paradoxus TaxID=34073 RepID=A0A2W5S2H8_VARPD|nr:IS5 family transposase [Pseudomonas aeruginosa]MBN8748697.1 IS5 family transposase [Variovorax sp.]PZQ76957.1 MAG: IS5 family transposase [Variovorax paradoxus]VTY29741.1 Transposase DDE domain protein [Xylophilus ampelinus]|tara:strand:- start:715 stop:1695 length:981 start_codon:yes stop_codon:yes gene_type:complete
MSQISFADAEYAGKRKKTRREVFLEEMEQVVPWKVLLKIIEPHYPVAGRGRRPYALASMLRVHLMQNWFALSDPAMEEALYEIASLRSFARLSLNEPIPDETTILNFRHLLEANDLAEDIFKAINALLARKGLLLKQGSIVDATIIAAPSSTKNAEGERDPEMHQTKKGNQWFFGMKAHIGVDADSGLVHTVTTTAANEADVEQVVDLLHGKEEQVWADSGYRGAPSRVDRELQWNIAARPSDVAKLPEGRAKTKAQKAEHRKASVRAKVEHPFRVVKRQFGLVKVRFRGLAKNTAHVVTLFALSNLWMARKQLLASVGAVRPKAA